MAISDFADFLDEIYGQIEICGYTYYASVALERVDPVAYRCAEADWESFREEEEEELPDIVPNSVNGHWYVDTYGRAPFTIHAVDCPTCEETNADAS